MQCCATPAARGRTTHLDGILATSEGRKAPRPYGRTGTIAAGALMLLGLVLLAAVMVFQRFSNEHAERAKQDLMAVAQPQAAQAAIILRERHGDAELLSRQPQVWEAIASRSVPGSTVDLLTGLRNTYGYSGVYLLDADLNLLYSGTDQPPGAVERSAMRRAMELRSPQLVQVHAEAGGEATFGVIRPVFSEGNRENPVIGLIYLETSVSRWLDPIAGLWPGTSRSGDTVIARIEDGQLRYIIPPRQLRGANPTQVRPEPPSREIREAFLELKVRGSTTYSGPDFRGVRVLGALVTVPGSDWILVAKEDYDEVLEGVRSFAVATGGIALLLMFLIVTGSLLLHRIQVAESAAEEAALDARYRSATRTSPDAYLVFDGEGRILDSNEAAQRMSGYRHDELEGMFIWELDPHVKQEEIEHHIRLMRTSGALRIRGRWRRADDSEFDVAVSTSYVPQRHGGVYHSFVRDISDEVAARRRIERLNRLYQYLSQANKAIFTAATVEEIFDASMRQAVAEGGFIVAWGGLIDEAAGRVKIIAAHGVETDYVRGLVITTDQALPTSHGPSGEALLSQKVQTVEDFQNDPRTRPWQEKAREHGVTCSVAVPVVANGKSIGVLNYYAAEAGTFDAEFAVLLEEVARNVSLALQNLEARTKMVRAQAERDVEVERFERAFLASPLPKIIIDRMSRRLRAVNRAFEAIIGYSLQEIPDQKTLFSTVYADEAFRAMVAERWESDISEAVKAGRFTVTESPELPISCKDGTVRTVRGFMTLAGDDIIVLFEDLTAIKEAEAALARSARHFRGMIEQNLVGVFVTQNDRVVYANPRLGSIIGRRPEELIGQPSLPVFGSDQKSLDRIIESRRQLAAGAASVELTMPVFRSDGVMVEVGFHTSLGEWDGEPAYIVIAIDVTERRRAEEQIAAYVRQLEGTMRDTLMAISRMVELRDPYTAGHELRVGEIAADIAAEMGWDERACENLRLVGLVHDIGKIAVPAEILTKPGRLSPIEYQIVQEHAQRGYEILQHVRFPVPIADIIRQHHERMDGSGYPQKLKGADIRMEARILAVADVVESMASHRPYRPALGLGAAVTEIEKNAGRWFDPDVVDAFLRLVREKNWVLPT